MLEILKFAISCLAVFFPAWLIASRSFCHQPLAGALLYLCLVLIQITVIQLAVGTVGWLSSTALFIGSIVLGLLLLLYYQRVLPKQLYQSNLGLAQASGSLQASPERWQLNVYGILVITLVSAVAISWLYPLISDLVAQIFLVHPLSWDVVSYHLPNALDYLQTGSLWTTLGTFSQYPGGNELLQIWSFLPLKLDVLLGITTATIALGFLLISTLLCHEVLPTQSPFISGLWVLALWVVCLSIPPFQVMLFDFGRNDLTAGFWALVAFLTLQKAATQPARFNYWLLGAGVSLGLMMGIKPYGFYYLIGCVGLIFSPLFAASGSGSSGKVSVRSKVISVAQFVILPALLLAGFWYLRNIIETGHLFDRSIVVDGASHSIIRNFFQPDFYRLNPPLILYLASWLVTAISILLCIFYRDCYSPTFKLCTSFCAISLLALTITPFSAGYPYLQPLGTRFAYVIQSRFGVASIPLTVILTLFLLSQMLQAFAARYSISARLQSLIAKLQHPAPALSTASFLLGVNAIGLVLVVLQLLSYQPPTGLPGFDSILFAGNTTPSQIYVWVQKNISNSTIYAIGLRPYGLYGFPFSNRVIYEEGSADWKYRNGLTTIQKFKPEFIALSVDPLAKRLSPEIALLAKQSQAFKLVFQDNLAAVFQVIDASKAIAATKATVISPTQSAS